MSKGKLTRRVALGMIAAGALVTVSETLGFSSVTLNRGYNINVAGDPEDELLGLHDVTDSNQSISISNEDDEATVFRITDNYGGFELSDIQVSVIGLEPNGDPNGLEATIQSSSIRDYDVILKCNGMESSSSESYFVELNFFASDDHVSIDADRTTSRQISIDCSYDYDDSSSYKDAESGDGAQPSDPEGTIENPGSVSEKDGESANIESGGGEAGKVGYSLPTVPLSNNYELEVVVSDIKGPWNVDVVNENGVTLAGPFGLSSGENTFEISGDDATDIASNRDNLYLIIEQGSSGNQNVSIDYINLREA
ncbi:hypothetical protein [Natronorubrum thiooxidans]|uniref:Uncharacterized protein n=1 Tax=Natronorubrum thiooxidans TaxID=308853 RepID=A0A1N7HA31_9EURY|nr:hypothetical protein [Natronorubrum thiooxidans]SIS21745.1 hypothetical protein SAMN05421752_14010 [Natronorubrum thiooxidans]